jgi:hypothetical protein
MAFEEFPDLPECATCGDASSPLKEVKCSSCVDSFGICSKCVENGRTTTRCPDCSEGLNKEE